MGVTDDLHGSAQLNQLITTSHIMIAQ